MQVLHRSTCGYNACYALQVGFYGSGITMDKARAAVEALQEQKRQPEGKAPSDLPFGRDSKRIFESAAEVRPCCSGDHGTYTVQ